MNVRVSENSQVVKAGQELVKQAREAHHSRRDYSRKEIAQSVKDMCGYFKTKAKSRVTYTFSNVTDRTWSRIFKKKGDK